MPTEAIQVITTTAERKEADAIAEALLQQRLAACVQISGPIDSSYWWNGRIETSREFVLTIKTRRELFPRLEAAILALHPYEQPEILAVAAVEVTPGYLQWLEVQTAK
ncbi:MAG: divalent-cation tolerance protein CutA [Pirellulaceae bacterium]|nr:divalent-cation tolerance protein CutA [Pirellulaceae bacterium]